MILHLVDNNQLLRCLTLQLLCRRVKIVLKEQLEEI